MTIYQDFLKPSEFLKSYASMVMHQNFHMGPHLTDSLTIVTDFVPYSKLMGQRQFRVPKALLYKTMQQMRQGGIIVNSVKIAPAKSSTCTPDNKLNTDVATKEKKQGQPPKRRVAARRTAQ